MVKIHLAMNLNLILLNDTYCLMNKTYIYIYLIYKHIFIAFMKRLCNSIGKAGPWASSLPFCRGIEGTNGALLCV